MAVPKLRFKEFDEDWTLTTLNQLSTKIGDGIHATPKYDESGTIPFINGNNLVNGRIAINENTKRISSEEFQKYNQILSDRTLFLSINGTIGNLAFYKNEKVLLGKSVCFINLKNDLDKKFIYLLLQSPQLTKTLNSELTGTTIKNLSLATVRNSEFYCPIEAEQTKIASFLSAVDEKISQLTQKHELLSQYKQGMMQKLFSQQIRFKADDGSEFGEWENKTLSNFIIKHIGGASLKPSDFVEQSEYEVIPKKAIVPNGYLNLDKDNPTYCSEDFFKANLKNTVDNTYLVTVLRDLVPSGPSIGYIVKYMENTQYILAQGVYGFKLKEELNKDFLIHFSNTKAYRLVMQSIMVGSTQVHIRNQDFFGIEIPVPCLEEQTKIANFLSAIDQKIEVVAQQIEQAKTWKKGLLQQMFV